MHTPSDLPDTLSEAVFAVARRAPERIAMQIKQEHAYRQCTYQQLVEQVEELAAALMCHDLRRGDRVAIVAENRPEWVIAYLGIVAAGGTAVPLDIQLSSGDLARLLARSDARLAFVSATTWPLLKNTGLPVTVIAFDPLHDAGCSVLDEWVRAGRAGGAEKPTLSPEDVASLLYTSGTTGEPKGVRLTHRNLLSNATAVMASGSAGADDRFLAILPLHHAYPFMVSCLVPLLLGAGLTFAQTLKGPELAQCLRESRITVLVGVPQVFAMIRRAIFEAIGRRPRVVRAAVLLLLALSGWIRRRVQVNLGRRLFATVRHQVGPSLRLLVSGGARLDPEVAEDFSRLGFTLLEGYGLTETAPVVTSNPLAKPKIGSVGIPIPGVEVRIVNPDAAGVGEVTVKGPNVMQGYDANLQATADAIRDGWFHTGDLGCLDEEGYLSITGRAKELIVTAGGKNIVPGELEGHYQRSPAIRELCVVGVARAGEGGEGLHAVVVPNFDYIKTLQVVDIRQLVKDELTRIGLTLPPYKRISGLTIITTPLPRTRLEKIQRYRVAAMVKAAGEAAGLVQPLSAADQALMETKAADRIVHALQRFVEKERRIVPGAHLDLDLGFDSLRRVELLSALEQSFGRLPDSLVHEVMTVRELIERVSPLMPNEAGAGRGAQSWNDLLKVEPPGELRDRLLTPAAWSHRLIASLVRTVLRLVFQVGFRLRMTGADHLPLNGPFLLAANHTSYLDPFVILAAAPATVFERLYSIGLQTYFRGALMQWVARVARVIPVGLEASLVSALQAAALVLRQGQGLLVFPEGQRSVDGTLKPFRPGIGILACELGVPVIPIWIDGAFQAWPVGPWWPRPHPVSLVVGRPVIVTPAMIEEWRRQGRNPYEAATQAIRDAIVALTPETNVHAMNSKGQREAG
ncbi:MAG: AMP-binding protein [Nitrospira sp.]|nr:AMP-binding protein [Nitrospira sp.]